MLHQDTIECSECGAQIGSHLLSNPESISTSLNPETSHHGPSVRPGERVSGSTFNISDRDANGNPLSGNWKKSGRRLSRVSRNSDCKHIGSRQRRRAKQIIIENTQRGGLRTLSLDLLDVGWPEPGSNESSHTSPIWKAAHPWGVGGSAAACIILASKNLSIDCRISELAKSLIPNAEKRLAKKAIFRALKSLRKVVGNKMIHGNTHRNDVLAIITRANLGETKYRDVATEVTEVVILALNLGTPLGNPRTLLAALTHYLADSKGIKSRPSEINLLFGCSRGYKSRINDAQRMIAMA